MADFDVMEKETLKIRERTSKARGRRKAFRTVLPGMSVRVRGLTGTFSVHDLSARGICLIAGKGIFTTGDQIVLDIAIAGKRYLTNVFAWVARTGQQDVGCEFSPLNRHQEMKLDKLVLEMQKRLIALRRQERVLAEVNKLPEEDYMAEIGPITLVP
jgi:hypothetical protein